MIVIIVILSAAKNRLHGTPPMILRYAQNDNF